MILPKVVLFISANEESIALFREAVGLIDPATVSLHKECAREAICSLEAEDVPLPDFIFFDSLPQTDSTAALSSRIRPARRNCAVVSVFASRLSLHDQKELAAAGVDYYLLKPKTFIHMVSVLQHVFTRHEERTKHRQASRQLVA